MLRSGNSGGVGREPELLHLPGTAADLAEAPAVRASVSLGELALAAGTGAAVLADEADASLPLEHLYDYPPRVGWLRYLLAWLGSINELVILIWLIAFALALSAAVGNWSEMTALTASYLRAN